MIEKVAIPIVSAALPLAMVVVFRSVPNEPQDVVPLLLVPILLYVGYMTGKAGPKVWIGVAVAITLALSIVYCPALAHSCHK